MFLCVLMVVALISSGYVLYKSWGLPNRNHFKLLLHCIMIVTSVVPPELPVTMSLTVTMALNGLFKKKLYCTEPFRIPLGGKLTYCCFDKTGTLTTSEVVLENVAGAPERSSFDYLKASEPELNSLVTDVKGALVTAATQSTAQSDKCVNATADCTKLPEITRSVMGICHGLVSVEKKHKLPLSMRVGEKGADQAPPLEIVGDPLEKTSCMAVNWVPSHEDPDVLTNTATKQTATIWRRFPFVSEAQRMTVVTEVKDQAGNVNSFGEWCYTDTENIRVRTSHMYMYGFNRAEVSCEQIRAKALLCSALQGCTRSNSEVFTSHARMVQRACGSSRVGGTASALYGCETLHRRCVSQSSTRNARTHVSGA